MIEKYKNMFLKSLEINGFKSFGQKTVFNFSPGITAIVGPNGSGKSNIAEAIRWVMGEQSLKSIRSKDGADLIFNGSLNKQRLHKAQVNLYFDNSLKKMPIDFEEVIISRIVYREGINEYFINNNQVRLKDVVDLLASSNIGQKNFSVISQGLSDSLIKLNPKELKSVIQDAAGIRPIELKKEEALKKLKSTRENIERIELMKSEIAPYLRNLKKQVSRFEQKEELEAKLKDLKQIKFNYEINKILESKNNFLNQKEELAKKIKAIEEESECLAKEIKKLEDDFNSNNEVLIELDKKIDNLQEEKLYYEKELSLIESKLEIEKEKRKISLSIDLNYVKNRLKGIINVIAEALKKDDNLFTKEWVGNIFNSLKNFLKEIELGSHLNENEKKEVDKETKQLEDEALERKKELQNRLNLILSDLEKEKNKLRIIKDEESLKKNKLFELERRRRELEDNKYHFGERLKNINAEVSQIEIKEKIIKGDNFEFDPELAKKISKEEIAKIEIEIARLERILEEAAGFDKNLIEEYNRIKERYEILEKECNDLTKAVEDLNKIIKELDLNIEKKFKDAFALINEKFDLYFKMIFAGGKAKIVKVEYESETKDDEEKEQDEDKDSFLVDYGIEIKAELPGKKAYNLNMFSGGERSLTAIALLFSLICVANPPFIVLDEIDAALDEANSSILKEFTNTTQFIIITHNRETMSHAGVLYGITMANDGVSKVFSLKLEEAVKNY